MKWFTVDFGEVETKMCLDDAICNEALQNVLMTNQRKWSPSKQKILIWH